MFSLCACMRACVWLEKINIFFVRLSFSRISLLSMSSFILSRKSKFIQSNEVKPVRWISQPHRYASGHQRIWWWQTKEKQRYQEKKMIKSAAKSGNSSEKSVIIALLALRIILCSESRQNAQVVIRKFSQSYLVECVSVWGLQPSSYNECQKLNMAFGTFILAPITLNVWVSLLFNKNLTNRNPALTHTKCGWVCSRLPPVCIAKR